MASLFTSMCAFSFALRIQDGLQLNSRRSNLWGYQDGYEVCHYDVPFDADALNRTVGRCSSGADYGHLSRHAASPDPQTVLEAMSGFQRTVLESDLGAVQPTVELLQLSRDTAVSSPSQVNSNAKGPGLGGHPAGDAERIQA
ncbi:hypothetical protein DEU56DRAFT_910923 [Suillus clintonianus]|uniref:uncharacterized protein n=1 Tax=Suillus clintonianus TaxID=1904413 RepID=UPI001B85D75C|nr:uncharacterized protein DEU56DRAFT_910923 [Suillus clintonianus]KAG2142986.1 hypothetical protein DEU56DRAFT_910923 [Suillus clintonianus]